MVIRRGLEVGHSEVTTGAIVDQRPQEPRQVRAWLRSLIDGVNSTPPQPLHPVIEEFRQVIEGDATLFMLFHQMFEEIPRTSRYNNNPTGQLQVHDYRLMLQMFNAPEFDTTGLVGFPINAILNWPMGTPSGVAAFLNGKVNAQIRKMLNEWARFLGSRDSTYVLTTVENGWFGEAATKSMPDFEQTFVCQLEEPYRGFKLWDEFFTREFRDGKRPVAIPSDDNVIIKCLRVCALPRCLQCPRH